MYLIAFEFFCQPSMIFACEISTIIIYSWRFALPTNPNMSYHPLMIKLKVLITTWRHTSSSCICNYFYNPNLYNRHFMSLWIEELKRRLLKQSRREEQRKVATKEATILNVQFIGTIFVFPTCTTNFGQYKLVSLVHTLWFAFNVHFMIYLQLIVSILLLH
jgi:hypothetical protein